MNKYAVYRGDLYIGDVHADNEADALLLAAADCGTGVRVELVSEGDKPWGGHAG